MLESEVHLIIEFFELKRTLYLLSHGIYALLNVGVVGSAPVVKWYPSYNFFLDLEALVMVPYELWLFLPLGVEYL